MKPPRSKLRGITRKGIVCETPRFLTLFPLQGNLEASSEESPDLSIEEVSPGRLCHSSERMVNKLTKPGINMFQEPDPIGHGAPRIRGGERLASSRVKGVNDIA